MTTPDVSYSTSDVFSENTLRSQARILANQLTPEEKSYDDITRGILSDATRVKGTNNDKGRIYLPWELKVIRNYCKELECEGEGSDNSADLQTKYDKFYGVYSTKHSYIQETLGLLSELSDSLLAETGKLDSSSTRTRETIELKAKHVSEVHDELAQLALEINLIFAKTYWRSHLMQHYQEGSYCLEITKCTPQILLAATQVRNDRKAFEGTQVDDRKLTEVKQQLSTHETTWRSTRDDIWSVAEKLKQPTIDNLKQHAEVAVKLIKVTSLTWAEMRKAEMRRMDGDIQKLKQKIDKDLQSAITRVESVWNEVDLAMNRKNLVNQPNGLTYELNRLWTAIQMKDAYVVTKWLKGVEEHYKCEKPAFKLV